jgi:uncharacterized membrane protein YoaK (UPF0700 family)
MAQKFRYSTKANPMRLLFRILIIAVAAFIAARVVPGVRVADAKTAILVALVLALLNTFFKANSCSTNPTYYDHYTGTIPPGHQYPDRFFGC